MGSVRLQYPGLGRAGVRFQPFRAAEPHGVLDERPRGSCVVQAQPGAHAEEGIDRQPTTRAGGAARGQHVIGPRTVITQHFRAERAQEHGAVVGQPRRDRGRVPDV